MRIKKRNVFLLVGFVLFIGLLIYLGINDGDKGAITIYTPIEEEYVEEYIKDFNAKYPDIKVNIVRDSSGVIASKLFVEKDNPRADVVWGAQASNALLLDSYGIFKG
ncbi:MAG: extracellular solute-binding protein, partial [Sarcina sp.]